MSRLLQYSTLYVEARDLIAFPLAMSRYVQPGAPPGYPPKLVHADGLLPSFNGHAPDILKREHPLDELRRRVLGEVDLPRPAICSIRAARGIAGISGRLT